MWETLRNTSTPFLLGGVLGLVALTNAQGLTMAWLARLPGTIAHELAHYVVALVTGSCPSPISLRLKRDARGWTLGEVKFHAGLLSAGWVALAPMYLLPLLAYGLWSEARNTESVYGAISGYVTVTLLNAAAPSRQDWSVAFRYPIGTLVALGTITFALAALLSGKI